jgi:hypothetical protein
MTRVVGVEDDHRSAAAFPLIESRRTRWSPVGR